MVRRSRAAARTIQEGVLICGFSQNPNQALGLAVNAHPSEDC